MNRKNTKRALCMSFVSLLLCCSMLVGSTFAWFTDTASTSVNSIQSGNLKIKLEMSKDGGQTWENAEDKTLDFLKAAGHEAETVLWEPGCTYALPKLRITNDGNLHLKFMVSITGIKGSAMLNEVIDWKVDGAEMGTASDLFGYKSLAPKASFEFTISGHMQESANNDYQDKTIDGIGITVFATQVEAEYDSFGNDYDADATIDLWDGTDNEGVVPEEGETYIDIHTAEELAALAKSVNNGNTYAGKTVRLMSDLDLDNREWTPIGHAVITDNKYDWANSPHFAGTFDGQGHTIYNLKIDAPETNLQGLFGYGKLKELKNVTIHNANVKGLRRSAAFIGQNDGAVNISNVNLTGDVKIEVIRNEAGSLVGRGGIGTVSNVTIDANEGSYIKCSTTNSASWEYVGGVWGHAWPSKATNVKSNIDVFAYASATGGIGGGCAVASENISCTGNVTLAIKDSEIHKGTIECWQTNGTIYGFGVGSDNAATHTNCTSTGTLTIGGAGITDLALSGVATGYGVNDVRFGSPYNLAGVIAITK